MSQVVQTTESCFASHRLPEASCACAVVSGQVRQRPSSLGFVQMASAQAVRQDPTSVARANSETLRSIEDRPICPGFVARYRARGRVKMDFFTAPVVTTTPCGRWKEPQSWCKNLSDSKRTPGSRHLASKHMSGQ